MKILIENKKDYIEAKNIFDNCTNSKSEMNHMICHYLNNLKGEINEYEKNNNIS